MALLILEGQKDLRALINEQIDGLRIFHDIFHTDTIEEGLRVAAEKDIEMFIVDLELPDGSGHDFIDGIRQMRRYTLTWVILMAEQKETAQQIIDAYNSNHCHRYLRKPFEMTYLTDMVKDLATKRIVASGLEDNRLRIKRKSMDYFFDHNEIVFVETVEKTAYIYTVDKRHKIGRITLSELEQRLGDRKFIRVHRSYIVNADYIDFIKKQNNQNQIKIKHYDNFIPVGRTYKDVLGVVL